MPYLLQVNDADHVQNWAATGTSAFLEGGIYLTRVYILHVSAFNKTSNVIISKLLSKTVIIVDLGRLCSWLIYWVECYAGQELVQTSAQGQNDRQYVLLLTEQVSDTVRWVAVYWLGKH